MIIYLKVKPNQHFDRIEKIGNDWQIRLKAPATEGKANEHLIEILSGILAISKSKIQLKKGKTSRLKCLEIDSEEATVLEKLALSINKTL
jgi:uncharacterized protein (TIGR00251 family)